MKRLYLILIQFSLVVSSGFAQGYIAYNNTKYESLERVGYEYSSIFNSSFENFKRELPEIHTSDINIFLNAEGRASIKATDIGSSNLINDEVVDMEVYPRIFDKDKVGRNVVELVIKTESGYNASSEAVVTVIDNLAPVVKTKNIRLKLGSKDELIIKASDLDNGSYDNCRIKSLTLSKNTFTKKDLGTNLVEVTVEDIFSNKASAIAIVIIED